ncbi:MAG: dihydropteroate synthase [Actinomycetota bacterium]|nr:dihydropteroate synthase [Actinomycetota bacterium]
MTPDQFRAALAGDDTLLMGVVNVTPDSFSDGGRYYELADAVAHGMRLLAEGADIVDVGGESTRPGAAPVAADEELRRVLPVVRDLAAAGAAVSIDTRHAEVAEAALAAGACLLNDVSGLRDAAMRRAAAAHGVPVVVMHMPVDDPAVMQQHTSYVDVVDAVVAFLREQAALALAEGVPSVIVDPGFGFGKTVEQNLQLVRRLHDVVNLGYPVLVGASRKRFIGVLSGVTAPEERLGGTLAVHLACVQRGARVVRVHDVAAHRQALAVWGHVS